MEPSYKELVNKALSMYDEYEGCSSFNNYSPVFGATTENLSFIYHLMQIRGKDLLVPASSGDQYITAKTQGAKTVATYDISYFTKFFTYLKIAALKYFDNSKDFKKFILPFFSNKEFLDYQTFLKVADYLPDTERKFWEGFLRRANMRKKHRLVPILKDNHLKHLAEISPIYSKTGYLENKQLFDDLEYPLFVLSDISDLTKKIDQQFDIVDCSNIIENEIITEYNSPFGIATEEDYLEKKWILFVKKELAKLLNVDGVIMMDNKTIYNNTCNNNLGITFNNPDLNYLVSEEANMGQRTVLTLYRKRG